MCSSDLSFLPFLQAVSLQPTPVLSLGLLSNAHVLAPNTHAHWWTHVLVWDPQGCGMYCLCRSHSVLSAIDWPFHPPLTVSDAPLLSQLISPLVRGIPQMLTSPLPQLPLGSQVPSSSSSLLFPFTLPGYLGIFPVLSCVEGLLLVFSRCSLGIVQSVDEFLIHL